MTVHDRNKSLQTDTPIIFSTYVENSQKVCRVVCKEFKNEGGGGGGGGGG